jgi:7-cyano-7-deazaguanine synthase in queuosine biosynthesis
MNYEATVYKPCGNKCGTCKPCKAFAKVLKEINLTTRSKYERAQQAQAELRRDR